LAGSPFWCSAAGASGSSSRLEHVEPTASLRIPLVAGATSTPPTAPALNRWRSSANRHGAMAGQDAIGKSIVHEHPERLDPRSVRI
jgi:hypothetical protein